MNKDTIVERLKIAGLIAVLAGAAYLEFRPAPQQMTKAEPPKEISAAMTLYDQVASVNASAAMVMVSGGLLLDEPADCLINAAMTEKVKEPDTYLQQAIEQRKTLCQIYTVLRETTMKNFEAIAFNRELPDGLMAFEMYDDDKWHTLGLFANVAECEYVRSIAVEANFGLKSCTAWSPRY